MKKSRPKIVFLDAGSVQYGDLSFKGLQSLGRFVEHKHTASAQIVKRLQGASIAITNKCIFDESIFEKLPMLRCLCVTATGVNNIDLEAAKKRKIAVANVSGYSTESVVQSTFAFLLALAGSLIPYDQAVKEGRWSRSKFFTLGSFSVTEIHGKKLGILGYGSIGKRVAKVAAAFGMEVLIGRLSGRSYRSADIKNRVPFETLLRESDFVTIHTPLTPLTRGLINRAAIYKMKKDACLINMARGGIIDEKALFQALSSGRIKGAASDVLSVEPPPRNHLLLKCPRLLLTPHIAWASLEARKRLIHEVVLNIQAFQTGKRRNRVV